MRERARDLVRHFVAKLDDLGRLQSTLEAIRPDRPATPRIKKKRVHREAVRSEDAAAGQQVLDGDVATKSLGIDIRRLLQRRLGAEDPQVGEPRQRYNQRPREAPREVRVGGAVALLVEGRHQDRGRLAVLPPGWKGWSRRRQERRDIGAPRNLDPERVVATAGEIVVFERAPEAVGLDPHDRVVLRVETLVATEDRRGDAVGLDPAGPARQRLVDHVSQEVPIALGSVEIDGAEDARKLVLDQMPRDTLPVTHVLSPRAAAFRSSAASIGPPTPVILAEPTHAARAAGPGERRRALSFASTRPRYGPGHGPGELPVTELRWRRSSLAAARSATTMARPGFSAA